MSAIATLGTNFQKMLETESSAKGLSADALKEHIELIRNELQAVVDAITSMDDADRKKLFGMIPMHNGPAVVDPEKWPKDQIGVMAYSLYFKSLGAQGKQDETQAFFGSIVKGCQACLDVLHRVEQAMGSYVNGTINVHNAKISHFVLIGMLQSTTTIAQFSVCLLNVLTAELTGELDVVPPYRTNYIKRHLGDAILEINAIYAKGGILTAIPALNKVKEDDVQLANDTSDGMNDAFIDEGKISSSAQGYIAKASFLPRVFRWFGEQWQLLKHLRYQKLARERDWLDKHVALLKLKLDDTDKNSPEYRHLVKVINNYSNMISEDDKKMAEYLRDAE